MRPLLLLFTLLGCAFAQRETTSSLLVRVDEETFGPIGNSHSHKRTEIYEDGRVLTFESWRGGATIIDQATNRPISNLHQRYGYFQLEEYEVQELSDFLRSSAVKLLSASYAPPHTAIDY